MLRLFGEAFLLSIRFDQHTISLSIKKLREFELQQTTTTPPTTNRYIIGRTLGGGTRPLLEPSGVARANRRGDFGRIRTLRDLYDDVRPMTTCAICMMMSISTRRRRSHYDAKRIADEILNLLNNAKTNKTRVVTSWRAQSSASASGATRHVATIFVDVVVNRRAEE